MSIYKIIKFLKISYNIIMYFLKKSNINLNVKVKYRNFNFFI